MRNFKMFSSIRSMRLLSQLAMFALCLLMVMPAQSQEVTAAINGTVTDPSGAAVANAKVTVKDLDRGTTPSTTTNDGGFYTFPRLPIGSYEVRVENPGFQASVQSPVQLQLNQIARIDFQLKVGNVSETVEVTSAAPVLQTQATQLGTIIDSRAVTTMPLATRNYVQLTLLSPGAVHPNPSSFQNGQATGGSGRPFINGNREQTNNFILDGIDNNQVSDNNVGYAPSPDAIQEFNLITNNASAEFGNFMGGIVSTSIKAGGNQFHGNIFEFFRNDKLNANQWQNNLTGAKKPIVRWNNFGGTIGGPIKRNKLFFFADYQAERLVVPSITNFSVLTPLERTGNFSQLTTATIRNPQTGTPYANNTIPTSQLSKAALNIVNSSYYPLPINNALTNNQTSLNNTPTTADQGDARIDWSASDKDRVFGRYSQSALDFPTTRSQPLLYNAFNTNPTKSGVVDWTRTVSPTFVNDVRFGVNYVLINNGTADTTLPDLNAQFGIPGIPSPRLAAMNFSGSNLTNFGTSAGYQLFADTVIQYGDTAIWSKGAHNLKMGFTGYRQRVNTFYSGNNGLNGIFAYSNRFSGRAESDFLLGLPTSVGTGTSGGTWGQRANIFGAYVQDDWHVSHDLTLNLGIRYELHTPWVEVKDRQTNFGLLSGAVETPGQNGNSRALYNTYNGIGNWQPRVGFAYSPGGGKTVVRGAYTLSTYLEGTGTNLRLTINPPFSSEHTADYSASVLPGSTLDQGYVPVSGGAACTPALLLANAPSCVKNLNVRLWDPNVMPAISNQWNFSVQRQLSNTNTVQLSYVGQRTTHLMVATPYLQRQLLSNGTVIASPYLSGNPGLASQIGQISGTSSSGNQSYNALQAVFQKRLSQGLQFQANYTWSKCMSDSIGYYGSSGQAATQSAYVENLYNRKAEWGPCFYDVTHILSGYVTYDLPFGRNRHFGKNMNKVVDGVVGGWQVNALTSLHGGFPITINAASDASGTLSRGARANCLAPATVFGERNATAALGGGYQWFDPSVYAQPSAGTFGNCGVGTVRGPGLHTVDFSIAKHFSVTEHQQLEVRGEFINLTNTPILQAPARTINSNPGLINTSQGARQVQIAAKYNF
jgi:hypothetical protein